MGLCEKKKVAYLHISRDSADRVLWVGPCCLATGRVSVRAIVCWGIATNILGIFLMATLSQLKRKIDLAAPPSLSTCKPQAEFGHLNIFRAPRYPQYLPQPVHHLEVWSSRTSPSLAPENEHTARDILDSYYYLSGKIFSHSFPKPSCW